MNKYLLILFTLILQLPTARAIAKYTPAGRNGLVLFVSVVSFLALSYLAYNLVAIFAKRTTGVTGRPILLFSLFLVFALLVWHIYPYADGLKNQIKGSDEDNCVIQGSALILEGLSPYSKRSYFGNPCSTGPGILVALFPFAVLGIYQFGNLIWIMATILLMKFLHRSWSIPSLYFVLAGSCLIFAELSMVGSDLVALGCLILASVLSLECYLENRLKRFFVAAAIVCGLAASSRINMMYLPLSFAIVLFFHDRKSTIPFLAISYSVALLPGVIFFFMAQDSFTPFHLITKGGRLLAPSIMISAIIANALTAIAGIRSVMKSWRNTDVMTALVAAPSLIFVSMGDLCLNDFRFRFWEGANYFLPVVPLTAYVFSKMVFAKQ